MLDSLENSLILVAETDQQAVGYIWATIQPPHAAAAFDIVRDMGLVRMVVHALMGYSRRALRFRKELVWLAIGSNCGTHPHVTDH